MGLKRFIRNWQETSLLQAVGIGRVFSINKQDNEFIGEMVEIAGAVTLPEGATSFRTPLASSEEGDLMSQFSGAFALSPEAQASFKIAQKNAL